MNDCYACVPSRLGYWFELACQSQSTGLTSCYLTLETSIYHWLTHNSVPQLMTDGILKFEALYDSLVYWISSKPSWKIRGKWRESSVFWVGRQCGLESAVGGPRSRETTSDIGYLIWDQPRSEFQLWTTRYRAKINILSRAHSL